MARVRKIATNPNSGKNYYLVDANFLVNRFIPRNIAPDDHQRARIDRCNEWWDEIEAQLKRNKARVYVPDICIAESFKTPGSQEGRRKSAPPLTFTLELTRPIHMSACLL